MVTIELSETERTILIGIVNDKLLSLAPSRIRGRKICRDLIKILKDAK